MRKNFLAFILILSMTLFLFGGPVLAAPRCETSLFGPRAEKVLAQIQSRLSKYGYEQIGEEVFKVVGSDKIRIGKIEIIQPRYLFEWQDQDYHDAWIEGKGINKQDMDVILAAPAQTFGRGFYVSLHPTDSSTYGTHLTLFEVRAPLVLIKDFSPGFVNPDELRKIGFAGVRATSTWLNIFNENYLNDAKSVNLDIFNKMLDPNNQVPHFDSETFLKIESIQKSVKTRFALNKVIEKLERNESIGVEESKDLQIEFLKNPKNLLTEVLKQKNKLTALKALLNCLSGRGFSISLPEPEALSLLQDLQKVWAELPAANSFFQLFDLFDIATLGHKKMKEPMTYSFMKASSARYQQMLDSVDFKSIKTANDFKEKLSRPMGLSFAIRDEDVVMSSYQKNKYYIEISDDFLIKLHHNMYVSYKVNKKRTSEFAKGEDSTIEASYFSLENLEKTKRIFTDSEYSSIQKILQKGSGEKNHKQALQLATSLIYKKLFDPSQFDSLMSQAPYQRASAFNLYQVFVSLHPFNDGNGRAARLYYRWLVTNHFKNEPLTLYLPVNEADLYLESHDLKQKTQLNWLLTRLWVLASEDEATMIRRSKLILRTDPYHSYYSQRISDIWKLTGDQ